MIAFLKLYSSFSEEYPYFQRNVYFERKCYYVVNDFPSHIIYTYKRHLHENWDNDIKWKLSVPSVRYIFEIMTFYSVMNNLFNSIQLKWN